MLRRRPSPHEIGCAALGALGAAAFDSPHVLISYCLTGAIVWTLVCARFGWLK